MTISKLSTLVSTQWLRQQIPSVTKLSSNLRVLDVSWDPRPDVNGYDIYKEGHIPTSLHFDLKEISPEKEGATCKYSIPEPKVFKDYVEDLGVSNHTHIVLYDRMVYRPAFRSWFLFRLFGHDKISVLDGGLKKWIVDGYPTVTDEPDVEEGDFKPSFRRDLLRDFDAMKANVKSGREQMLDSRGSANFNGTDNVGGHMPGSLNIPFDSFVTKDGMFKSVEELKDLFDKANVDLNKPMVATCMTAMTACTLAAAAFQIGKEDVPLYNGSYTEWSQLADPKDIVRLNNEE